jgi:hypothetical protein
LTAGHQAKAVTRTPHAPVHLTVRSPSVNRTRLGPDLAQPWDTRSELFRESSAHAWQN